MFGWLCCFYLVACGVGCYGCGLDACGRFWLGLGGVVVVFLLC